MAAAMLDRELARRNVQARIHSAGTNVQTEVAATSDALAVMSTAGLDLSTHRSRPVDVSEVNGADIIVTMTRAQLRDVATRSPAAFPRLFTLKELARRASDQRPRADEDIRAWVTRLGAGRRTTDLLGDDPLDDVEDPTGSPIEAHAAIVQEMADAISAVVAAGWPGDDEGV